MKIEKVNDHQIRCTLTKTDLSDRKLKLSELAYGTEKARILFKDMIQQASYQFGFEAEDIPLMIEAIPLSGESIVLVITKVEDPEELDTRFSRFAPDIRDDMDSPEEGDVSKVSSYGADDVIDVVELDTQVVIVKLTSGIHLNLLGDNLTSRQRYGIACSIEGIAAKHDASSVLIHIVGSSDGKDRSSLIGRRTLITHINGETGRFAVRHVRHDALFRPDAQLVYAYGLLVVNGACLEELRLALILPWRTGSAAIGHEDEVAVHLFVITGIGCPVQSGTQTCGTATHMIERVLAVEHEHIGITVLYGFLNLVLVHLRAIDADTQVRLVGGTKREACLL